MENTNTHPCGQPDWLLDSAQASRFLGVAESTVRKWVHSSYVPHIKLGRLVRFNSHSLEKWLQKIEKTGRTKRADLADILGSK